MALKVWPCFEIFFICFFYLFLEQGCPWPTKRGNTVLNSCKILSLSLLYAVPLYVLNSLLWVYHCVVHSSPLAWLAVQDRTSWVEDYRNRRLGRGFIQLLFYRQRHLCAACEVSELPWRMTAKLSKVPLQRNSDFKCHKPTHFNMFMCICQRWSMRSTVKGHLLIVFSLAAQHLITVAQQVEFKE